MNVFLKERKFKGIFQSSVRRLEKLIIKKKGKQIKKKGKSLNGLKVESFIYGTETFLCESES